VRLRRCLMLTALSGLIRQRWRALPACRRKSGSSTSAGPFNLRSVRLPLRLGSGLKAKSKQVYNLLWLSHKLTIYYFLFTNYYFIRVYQCSPREIGKIVISRDKFNQQIQKSLLVLQKSVSIKTLRDTFFARILEEITKWRKNVHGLTRILKMN
jgi:hypothetical protein